MSEFTAPYHMLPSSIYRDDEHLPMDDEYLRVTRAEPESYRRQVSRGIRVGTGYHVRFFPVWFSARGNNGILLSATRALLMSARLRRDKDLAELAQEQLQWVVGRNPFAQSIMYGEGHDFMAQYSAMSGQIVGAITVGIETRADNDVPYWPSSSYPTWKEVWTHADARWLGAMGDLAGLPFTRHPSDMDFQITKQRSRGGTVIIQLRARANGKHCFAVRADNLTLDLPERELNLGAAGTRELSWQGRIGAAGAPWVAVIVPDGDLSKREEVFGWPEVDKIAIGQRPRKKGLRSFRGTGLFHSAVTECC